MTDTDKLIAAIFAATMTARESAPTASDFFGFFDACVTETLRRETVEAALRVERKLAADKKTWG